MAASKFDTCKFRSKKAEKVDGASINGCGSCAGIQEQTAYICWQPEMNEMGIRPNEKICGICVYYKERRELEEI